MAKGPFKMRSGNATPFKEMGSSAVKQTISTSGQFDVGEKPESLFAKYPQKTKESIKKEEADKGAAEVLADTDKQIALTKKKSREERETTVKEKRIALEEKKYEEGKTPKKTGPSIEQQLADKKVADLQQKKSDLLDESKEKGWSARKFNRKEKRINRKLDKAIKLTDPLVRQERAMKGAKAQDIFKALSMGGKKWAGSRTAAQDALRAQHQQGLVDKDVDTSKSSGKTDLDPGDTFVHDYRTGDYSKEAEDLGLGFKEKGKVDYGTWSDEDLEKRRADPTYRPS
jgi:hypothetical protein